MNYEEFIQRPQVEIDVQKAVVEELAADKAVQEEKIESLTAKLNEQTTEIAKLKDEKKALEEKIAGFDAVKAEMVAALEKVGETLARNTELPVSNQISVLDRNIEVDDRFEGETRDHILEVLKDARDAAETEGRLRRAQILEAVLAVNEPRGLLAKKREALNKLFADNLNIINGQVINELDNMGIRYKDGENYLLAKEIAKRSF